jgi:hypothetical protein
VDHLNAGDDCGLAEAQATVQAPAKVTRAGEQLKPASPEGAAGRETPALAPGALGTRHGVLRARAITGVASVGPPAVGSRETGARHAG